MSTSVKLRTNLYLGLVAAFGSVCIGSAWQVLSRHSVLTTIGALDLAVLRYLVPALILLPITLRMRPALKSLRWNQAVLLVTCGGSPLFFAVVVGEGYAPVAHVGVLFSGAMPLFTAALAAIILQRVASTDRLIGLFLILCGTLIVAGSSALSFNSDTIRGDALFLLAALLWAAFGLVLRSTTLTVWESVALVSTASTVLLIPVIVYTGLSSLRSAPLEDILVQTSAQGLAAGLLGQVLYNFSIARLGAQSASSFAALAPVLSAVGGWAFLSEEVATPTFFAIAATSAGVFVASGILNSRRQLVATPSP